MGRNYNTGYECERCDGENGHVHEVVSLAGCHVARLCPRCRNEWDAFIRPHDLWRAKSNLEARGLMLVALTQADGQDRTAELERTGADSDGIMIKLAAVAKQWIEEAE